MITFTDLLAGAGGSSTGAAGCPRPLRSGRGLPGSSNMTGLPCIACGRTDPCPDCRHHNRIPGWEEPTLPLEENEEE